jgi:GT2 family glycosyltransferase
MKEAAVDLVVVNYKTPADLESFLHSLEEFPPARPYVLHVGNIESGEADHAVTARWIDPGRPWYFTDFFTNIGYNTACNHLGAAHVGTEPAEVVACFNADVRLTAGAIDVMCDELMAHEDWGIAGPRQINERGQITAGGIFGSDVHPQHRGWKAMQGYQDIRDDCTVVCGSAIFIKRSVWDELASCEIHHKIFPEADGPWPPLHHFYGDTGLSYHARGHGYRLGFVGSTTITHKLHGAGRKNIWTKADREDFRAFLDAHGLEHE